MISTRGLVSRTLRSPRACQTIGACTLLAIAAVLAATGEWPFNTRPPSLPVGKAPTLAQFFVQDRLTLGFVRLGLALLAVFVAASIPALIIAGRWIKGFTTSGLSVDEVSHAVANLEARLAATTRERDQLKAALSALDRTGK